MSLYAIKDEDGELRDRAGETPEETNNFYTYTDHAGAEFVQAANYPGGRVVELVEKAEPVEESEDGGRLLNKLRQEIVYGETDQYAADYVRELHTAGMSIGDIFRALDVGWTVKQSKRWYVKTPRVEFGWYVINVAGILTVTRMPNQATEFTAEEIERYHLGGFETVEVED